MVKEVKFAMYQPIKWYMWPMACFTNPSFSDQRIELTKPISLVYVIDDIFDVYGTLDQLTVFTDAVNRFLLSFFGTCARSEQTQNLYVYINVSKIQNRSTHET